MKNTWKRGFSFVLTAMMLAVILVGSELWSVQTPEASARISEQTNACPDPANCGYIPIVFDNYSQSNVPATPIPTLALTPEATSTSVYTPTPTFTPTPTNTPAPPEIISFAGDPPLIYVGESSILKWTITGTYDTLTINPGNIDVTGLTQLEVMPDVTTEYWLIATHSFGNPISTSTTVEVGTRIDYFGADPVTIDQGESATLSWAVSGPYQSIKILPQDIDVTLYPMPELEVTPEETTQYTLEVTLYDASTIIKKTSVYIGTEGEEVVAFLWNENVEGPENDDPNDPNGDNGFPNQQPVRQDTPREGANGDWTLPPNYAKGKLYYHWELRSQPTPQNMNVAFCMWQTYTLEDGSREPYGIEYCLRDYAKLNTTGTTEYEGWEYVDKMFKKEGRKMDFTARRQRYGFVIKNDAGCQVTDLPLTGREILGTCPQDDNGILIDWAGEDPADWYPADMCLIVVAVGQFNSFSGWENYTHYCDKEVPPEPTPEPTAEPTTEPARS
jgi:hypothetical protein